MTEFTASKITARYIDGATVFTLPMHHKDTDDYADMVRHAARFTGATVTEEWFTFPECLQMIVRGGAVHTLPLNGETVGIGDATPIEDLIPFPQPTNHPTYGTNPTVPVTDTPRPDWHPSYGTPTPCPKCEGTGGQNVTHPGWEDGTNWWWEACEACG
jgi:hypothetical protein